MEEGNYTLIWSDLTPMVQSVGSGVRNITVYVELTDMIGRLKELMCDRAKSGRSPSSSCVWFTTVDRQQKTNK